VQEKTEVLQLQVYSAGSNFNYVPALPRQLRASARQNEGPQVLQQGVFSCGALCGNNPMPTLLKEVCSEGVRHSVARQKQVLFPRLLPRQSVGGCPKEAAKLGGCGQESKRKSTCDIAKGEMQDVWSSIRPGLYSRSGL
jgi:hypothetical protein